jgi:hypothetical protein
MPAIMAGIVVSERSRMSIRLVVPALIVAALAVSLPACTIVRMAPGASKVRVVERPPNGCERRGEIEVSVRDSIPFYERNHLRVRDELEVLARNEAPGLGADTVQPAGPPVVGEQRFVAWRCRR